jgi:hypothetical protein
LLLAIGSTVDPVARLLAQLTGGGLLRDGQRLLAPWCLAVAVGVGLAVPELARVVRTRAAYALVALPVVVLPSLGWGVAGRLDPVHYPTDITHVAALLAADPRPGAVLVLPFQPYRQLTWNHGQTSLDPMSRLLDRTVIISSDLPVLVDGQRVTVPGEDRLAAAARRALGSADPARSLAGMGVRWVVRDGPDAGRLAGSQEIYAGPNLSVYEIAGTDPHRASDPVAGYAPPRWPVVAGDGLWVLLVLGALGGAARNRRNRRNRLLLFGNRSGPLDNA